MRIVTIVDAFFVFELVSRLFVCSQSRECRRFFSLQSQRARAYFFLARNSVLLDKNARYTLLSQYVCKFRLAIIALFSVYKPKFLRNGSQLLRPNPPLVHCRWRLWAARCRSVRLGSFVRVQNRQNACARLHVNAAIMKATPRDDARARARALIVACWHSWRVQTQARAYALVTRRRSLASST